MELFLKTPVYRNAKRIESFSKVYVHELCVCIRMFKHTCAFVVEQLHPCQEFTSALSLSRG